MYTFIDYIKKTESTNIISICLNCSQAFLLSGERFAILNYGVNLRF